MTQEQLREFIRQKKERARPADVDWAARRDAWINAVRDLYRTIADDYLKSVKTDVEITFPDKVVTENLIGEYRIPELHLRVGDELVVFSPKGANVIGAMGRIDVEGDRGGATFVWQGADRWSIVVSRTPALRLIPLTADSLTETLQTIMRP